jgi:uncharacterized membrane protein YeaQ/YmgE (transglycosylase-associated protein family)
MLDELLYNVLLVIMGFIAGYIGSMLYQEHQQRRRR